MNNTQLDILQKKQNKALRIILRCNKYTRISDMLNATNLLSVRQIIFYNTMIFIYKMLNKLVPAQLLENCTFVKDIHQHNTRSQNNFYLHRVSTNSSQNSLYYKGLKQYNKLPKNVRDVSSLSQFKRACIMHVRQNIAI